VLLHGIMESSLSWLRTARALEADYDLILVDARGRRLHAGAAHRGCGGARAFADRSGNGGAARLVEHGLQRVARLSSLAEVVDRVGEEIPAGVRLRPARRSLDAGKESPYNLEVRGFLTRGDTL
jgi:pimeloyl-ACP methyl ester carboxylesterase